MFTKQHYEAIADVLSRARGMTTADKLTGLHNVEALLLDLFENDSPNFQLGKFLAASAKSGCRCENAQHYLDVRGTPGPHGCAGDGSLTWPTVYGDYKVCKKCDLDHQPPAPYMREV